MKIIPARHAKSFAILITALMTIASLSYPSSVSATSTYDDAVSTVSSMKLDKLSTELDVTQNYAELMKEACGSTYYDSLMSAISNGGDYTVVNYYESKKVIRILWTPVEESPLTAQFASYPGDFRMMYLSGVMGYAQFGSYSSVQNKWLCDFATMPGYMSNIQISANNFGPGEGVFANTYDINYPSGYEGPQVPSSASDNDGDGLATVRELIQGTSDNDADTDKDGIDDYKESKWYPDRDDVFCDTAPTPHVCAYPDPLKQDVYVEVDWMDDAINSRTFKPSNTQIELIKNAFTAQGVNFHADTGQFGGGNEIPIYNSELHLSDTPSQVDFGELKNGYGTSPANFDSERNAIWRYLISGYSYAEDTNSSGISEVGGDDIFISHGLIKYGSFWYSNLDNAIAGTMMHEIGHSLCLSSTAMYISQPPECVHEGIDTNLSQYLLYPSVMNYFYQFSMVDYSAGSVILNDHNDWNAIKLGMPDFAGISMSQGSSVAGKNTKKIAFDLDRAQPNEMTPEQSKEIYQQNQTESQNTAPSKTDENNKPNEAKNETLKANDNNSEQTLNQDKVQQDKNSPWSTWPVQLGGGLIAIIVIIGSILFYRKNKKSKLLH